MNILLCGKVYPCAPAPDKERRSHPPLIKKGLSRARQVIFRSKDFASVERSGFGFNNRRPMANPWQY